MQVKYLESNIKIFVRTSIIIFTVFTSLLIIFSVAYAYASLKAYNIILIAFIVLIAICLLVLSLMCMAIIYTYRNRKAGGFLLMLTKAGMQIMLPLALLFAKANSQLKKHIRFFYIELNNIVVESDNKKYKAKEIIILLPHCLQNSECGLKVTSNPGLCRRCGKCKIGELLDYTEKRNIGVFIATGGTVARNIIKQNKPKLIISVACERDLMSGMLDVKGIPVIGVTNQQPNGPCINTDVDFSAIRNRVEQLTY
ncbi:MAG: hypothetical protein K0R50_2308 [Eubacterium sp.]|nr:hypothetical protein [Eubacterium sp.]